MKLIASIFLLLILIFGCQKESFESKELLMVSGNLINPKLSTYLFLSDQNGKVLTCVEHIGEVPRLLKNRTPMDGNYFDFSIVTSINSTQNILRIETHSNIKRAEWKFKSDNLGSSPQDSSEITFLADDLADNIEYALIDGFNGILTSMNDLKTTGSYTTYYSLNKKYLFLRFKLVGEEQYRYVEFNNLTIGDTIPLDLASYPLGELENLQSNGANYIKIKKLTGLRIPNNFKNSSVIYRHNIFIQDYILPDGKVWYPNGIFDSFYISLEMKTDSLVYLLDNIGQPIYEYTPTSSELTIQGDKMGFQVRSNQPDVDFVSATWSIEKPEGLIEWTVFHQPNETNFFTLPELPNCIPFDQNWFTPEDFKLKSIHSYHYQNFETYDDYINSRYGNVEGGEGGRLIIAGGKFEKKIILFD